MSLGDNIKLLGIIYYKCSTHQETLEALPLA